MAAWTLAICFVRIRAHFRLSPNYEVPNRYQGALVLSKAIAEDFATHVPEPTAMSNKDFAMHRSKTLKGGSVRHDSARTSMGYKVGVWASTKKWLQREKWWCLAFAVLTVWNAAGWVVVFYSEDAYYYHYDTWDFRNVVALAYFYMLSLWTWPSFVFAMPTGTTTKSRLFFMGVWVIPAAVLIIALFINVWVLESPPM